MNFLTPRNIILAIVFVLVGSALFGTAYTVNDREKGVILTNGKVTGVADPGLHFKIPFVQSVVIIPTTNQSLLFPKLTAYSKDQQSADLKVSVSYHITDVVDLYKKYSSIEGLDKRLIERQVPTQLENVFGQYTAADAVTKRVEFGIKVDSYVRKALEGPLVVDSVQVENIDFDDAYEANIRKMMEKNVEIQTQVNETQRQIETNKQKVNLSEAEATATRQQADAEAYATRQRGDAEAYAITARAKALALNPNLVDLVIAETWDGALPSTMIPGGSTPMIKLPQ